MLVLSSTLSCLMFPIYFAMSSILSANIYFNEHHYKTLKTNSSKGWPYFYTTGRKSPKQRRTHGWTNLFDSPKSGTLLTMFQTEGHTFVPILDEDTGWDCEDACCRKGQNIRGFSVFWENHFYSISNFSTLKERNTMTFAASKCDFSSHSGKRFPH